MKYTNENDPIPESQPMAREIRDILIAWRSNLFDSKEFDPGLAITLSHLIAAMNTGCIVQVKEYIPDGN